MGVSETSAYQQLGVSATKDEVHKAVEQTDPGLFPGAFCRVGPDVLTGDPDYCLALHTDDAGTKTLVPYLMYCEGAAPEVFRSLAQDALVMNLDDLLCIGATQRFAMVNTIARNTFHISGKIIEQVIAGYEDCRVMLKKHDIDVVATGGETADPADCVRTLMVGATLAARLPRDKVIDNARIKVGDVIVGMSSTGQASYESAPNSGIGSNGLTLARHAMLNHDYARTYPESWAAEIDPRLAYRGEFHVNDQPPNLGMTVGQALASPTRTYAPVIKAMIEELGIDQIHGLVHCTGGGQTKCKNFGKGIRYVKDHLFDCPPVFQLIAEQGEVPWGEMYQTFNMGHRMEAFVSADLADRVIALCQQWNIDAQIVGRCEQADAGINQVRITSPMGSFDY